MKITVDTSHDSHEDIRKVIKMLQHLVEDFQEISANQPEAVQETSPIANIFGGAGISPEPTTPVETTQETKTEGTEQSTDDLFADLFSEEEIKKMDSAPSKDDEGELPKSKGKKYNIEFY